ncbi:hypothetical protein SARC_12901 [Sphaeroforma arctica JP610]|uniref:Uncharacterized protein n=1 Tax=Sphaeroforma arctica JP610 TaxID=667725 RepID=A0A0L0FCQ9_9EUKA|nr:hypothetical protein SARC_12901 [Sphaeroforma arctica JP610]KNC74557.1 hypothetical protein SARC_12901 [Sphaeroforma arctica JP610]|eukprot:XP_014148459.1 hypothetical protein SARC_12901 [Sphaeroforma arctica JP610]
MMPLTQGFGTLADKLKPQESKFVFDMGLQAPLVPQLANRKEEPLTATHTLMSDVLAFMLSLMHNEVITLGQEPCKVADVSRFSQRAQGLIWIFDLWKRNHLSVLFYDTCNELNIRQDPCRQPACFMWHVEDVPPDR